MDKGSEDRILGVNENEDVDVDVDVDEREKEREREAGRMGLKGNKYED